MCQECRVKKATDVHHIRSINAGGSKTEFSNLASLCHECHSKQTLYERFGIDRVPIKGCDINGRPLDPQHHWNNPYQTRDKARSRLLVRYNAKMKKICWSGDQKTGRA